MTATHRTEPVARQIWQRPALRTDEDQERARAVSSLELFFDLVFVVVVSRLSHQLADHHAMGDIVGFSVQFLAIFWVWNGFTFYNERFESDGLENRLLTFLAMIPVAGLAVFAENGLRGAYPGFAVAYLMARLVTQISWARAGHHVPHFRAVSIRFHVGFIIAVAIVLASFRVDGSLRVGLFLLAVIVEIATPWFTAAQQAVLPRLSTSKFPERFGLLTIIVLGESVVGVIVGLSELRQRGNLDLTGCVAGVLGLGIGFALWWIYFDFIARRAPKPVFLTALVWVYLHLVALAAIAASGAGILLVITDAGARTLSATSRELLVGSVAIGLLGIAVLQITLARAIDEPTHRRLSPILMIGVAAGLALLGGLDLGWGSTSLLAFLLTGLGIPIAYGTYVWFRRMD